MSDQSIEQGREEARTYTFNPNEHLMQIKSGQSAKDYLPVQWRLVWFRSLCPHGTIQTEMLHLDLDRDTEEDVYVWSNEKRRSEKVTKHAKGFVIFKATVQDGKGGVATGTKSEKGASFPDFVEKAETGAIGRALAALGYGTQFAPELDEQHRIVDSPVDRQPAPTNGSSNSSNGSNSTNSTNGTASLTAMRPANGTNGMAQSGTRANGSQPVLTPPTPPTSPTMENSMDAVITEQQITSIRKLCEHLGKAEPENVTAISYGSAKRLIQQLSAEYRESRQKKAS